MTTSNAQPSDKRSSAEKPMPLSISTEVPSEEKPAEICLSPSWSDHGEKAKKKEKRRIERERKEREKKPRHDEKRPKTTDLKGGKRLSKKPPPAAMETQKMPTSLRRNSWMSFMSSQSSSEENTRRPSRDEKRLSGMSFGSIRSKRSQSTPGTSTDSNSANAGASESWQPIVSSSAPKLPSFRWSSSRRNSSDRSKSASPGSDDACQNELIAFAYQLDAGEIAVEPEKFDLQKVKQDSIIENSSKPPGDAQPLTKTATEPDFISGPDVSVSSKSPQEHSFSKNQCSGNEAPKAHDRFQSAQSSPAYAPSGSLPSPRTVFQMQARPSHDGSSYVHKQRMHHQQQSIAGFEDQQAIKIATEAARKLAAEYEARSQARKTAPDQGRPFGSSTPRQAAQPINSHTADNSDAKVSTIYTKQRDRSTSPQDGSNPAKHQPADPTPLSRGAKPIPESQVGHHGGTMQSMEHSGKASRNQVSASSKPERILGFRRRNKQPPALVSIPYNVDNQVMAVQSAPMDILPNEEPAVKRSKIERLFGEPKPAFANRDRRSSSSSSRSRKRDDSPRAKSTHSHSRTRTSSSTALNDDYSPPLPKSATEPALDKKIRPVERTIRTKSDHSDQKAQTDSAIQSQKAHSRQLSAVTEPKPKSPLAPSTIVPMDVMAPTGPAPKDNSLTKVGKKQPHEIVVETETGEGLIRKTSIKRPRSNPQLQTQTTATNSLPNVDFLPPLKHQPLVKRERQSPTRAVPGDASPISIAQFQEPVAPLAYEPPNPPDLKLIPRSPLRPPSQFPVPVANRFNRSSTDVGKASFGKGTSIDGVDAKPTAKLFVICCKCKFWHDLPSRLYEAMALPLELHKADKGKVAGARLETAVKCPWCEHAMTTSCCQGWTTVVYMHERHH